MIVQWLQAGSKTYDFQFGSLRHVNFESQFTVKSMNSKHIYE